MAASIYLSLSRSAKTHDLQQNGDALLVYLCTNLCARVCVCVSVCVIMCVWQEQNIHNMGLIIVANTLRLLAMLIADRFFFGFTVIRRFSPLAQVIIIIVMF